MAACGNDGQNNIFLFGGKTVSVSSTDYEINIYNAATDILTTEPWDTWQISPSPPTSFEIEPHHYAQFNISYISAVGWKPVVSNMNKFYAFFGSHQTHTNTFTDTTGANVGGMRWCTYIHNDLLYFIGGAITSPHYATVDATAENTMSTIGAVTNGQPNIEKHGCAIFYDSLNNADVYVFGGRDLDTYSENLPVYKCSADYTACVAVSGSENNIWPFAQAVVVDELIFVIGGVSGANEGTPTYSNNIKVWDPYTDAWLSREPPAFIYSGRVDFHVQWLQNLKKLVIIGGNIEFGYTPDTSIYIYSFRELTDSPTKIPTISPITATPTYNPSNMPTMYPSNNPSNIPTINPSTYPSKTPTISPSKNPSDIPTRNPSFTPTI
eukprot:100202_1